LKPTTCILFFALASATSAIGGCTGERTPEPETPVMTSEAMADYELFAVRCSKCHSLARPLSAGIADDEYWKAYVEKMRRQPGSGISVEDSVAILRFLHVYSMDLKRRRGLAVTPPQASQDLDASAPAGNP
jgi:hypothetical protein